MEQPITFSLKTQPQGVDATSLQRVWREADQMDFFRSAWIFDHLYGVFVPSNSPCFESWTLLSYLAAITERIRIGIMVTSNTFRHPSLLANMVCTVDVLSNGRLELGLGAGWFQKEHDDLGFPFPPAGERLARLDEACNVLHLLLTEPVANFEGNYYQLSDAVCNPKPIQKPHPPFVIGGAGERRTLRTVARWADHWNFPKTDPNLMARKLEILEGHCRDVGRDFEEIEISAQVRIDPSDVPRGIGLAAEFVSVGAEHVVFYLEPPYDDLTVLERIADKAETGLRG